MRRALPMAILASLALAGTAHGHAVVQPSASRPADPQVYRVTVPNEMESPATEVRLRIPAGIDFVLVESPPAGWEGEIHREGKVAEIRWTGGEILPEQYATFRFLVRNPVEEGEITWPIVQRYQDGSVQRWIGPPDSDEPASRTVISESATPTDIVAVNGERLAAAQEASSPAAAVPLAPAAEAEPRRDALTVTLAAGAFVLAALAFAQSLMKQRRRPA